MIQALLYILLMALILYVVYWLVGMFLQGTAHKIVGAILGLILLLLALKRLGFADLSF